MDHISKQHRSWNMSKIRSKNTKPELQVRSLLHRMGYRFRLHRSDLPGKPDIVLPKYKAVLFVHGCFWHRHKNCKYTTTPKSNIEFWNKKFSDTVARDNRNRVDLEEAGWKVIVVWQCQLEDESGLKLLLHDSLAL